MEKSRAIELLKLAVPIKALTQQEYADFVEAVNMGMDALKAQLFSEDTTSDLISRTATIDAVNNAFDKETILALFVRSIALRAIRDMPSAQPERKKGEWIDYTKDGYVECPFCHSATNCDGNKDELHFCFSCGADMRGGQDERG